MGRAVSFAGFVFVLMLLPVTGDLRARQLPSRQVFKLAMDAAGHETGSPTQAIDGFDESWNPSISPDGRQIAHWFRSGDRSGIALRDTATGSTRRLIDQAMPGSPSSAVDLSKPALLRQTVLTLAGDPLTWLSSNTLVYAEPRRNADDITHLRTLNTTTASQQPLRYGDIYSSTWQPLPQRNELAYVADSAVGDGRIHIRSLADGRERILDTGPGAVVGFVLSSDQRQLAYLQIDLRFSSLLELEHPDTDPATLPLAFWKGAEIRTIGVDGHGDRSLVTFPGVSTRSLIVGPLAWSPDDRFLLFRGSGGRFRITATDAGGQGWALGGLIGDAISGWGHPRWAADGSIWMTKMTGMTTGTLPPPPAPGRVDPGAETAFVEWARTHAAPIASIELSAPSDDLKSVVAWTKGARLVGLGEATHGTHDIFALKNRIIAALAADGLTDVLFESSLPEVIPVDEYIQGGPGDAEALVDGMGYWTFNTEEVVDLVKWLRAWNTSPAHARRIHFRGIDMNFPAPGLAYVKAFADKWRFQVPLPSESSAPFLYLQTQAIERAYTTGDKGAIGRATAALDNAARAMDSVRDEVSRRSGTAAFDLARHCLDVARQSHARNIDAALRDGFLATNALWWLDQAGPNGRAALWAHNAHIKADSGAAGADLRRALADRYLPVGLFFGRGEFRARPIPEKDDVFWEHVGVPRVWPLAVPTANFLETALARLALPNLALDLRAAPQDGAVAQYLGSRIRTRIVGSVFNPAAPAETFHDAIRQAYDIIVFAADTTAAVPTATARAKLAKEGR